MKKKRALVIAGGGGCGRVPASVVCQLDAAGFLPSFDFIIGTSVGGIIAAQLAKGIVEGVGSQVVRMGWDQIQKNSDVYTPELPSSGPDAILHLPSLISGVKRTVSGPGFFDVSALYDKAHNLLGTTSSDDLEGKTGQVVRTRALSYEVGVVDTLEGDLVDMALASSAIEVAFPQYKGYGDGGIGDNCPIGEALKFGAEEIFVLYCGPDSIEERAVQRIDRFSPFSSLTGLDCLESALNHITSINEANTDREAQRARESGVIVVDFYPQQATGSALDFSPRGLWELGDMVGLQGLLVCDSLGLRP